ncbi:IS200/IS605 family transposase [Cecembia calidifontis]|jgi:REP element-mobilizing transposase RayT|uniref:REP element-mobilizing transposase RayT n=1 Tax=Cecembia calidifontis TaxID=1187080 RepID=A0A4Q7P464_9BACT|nr:IS200/IS605 family transposase [Cecembia calidifontis]RZS94746.1 REP element-mobilizing transposase RayT [Cecembia calidifontis]
MANTFTQIHIQVVFAVKNRACLIRPEWKDDLFRYMTGIIQKREHKLLAINGVSDHVHILIGLRPSQSISDLMKETKIGSMNFINDSGFIKSKFSWQDGYGAFSYSMSHISRVIKYIQLQEAHHKKKTFLQEYTEMLDKFQIPFEERYLFKPVV